jgi:chemotaxis protein CheD
VLYGDEAKTKNGKEMREHLILQGDYYVSSDQNILLTTLLGSCVATCLFDPIARVGGMNHFLLASGPEGGASSERYGLYAMEVLINGLLKLGAKKGRMEAKQFGGANMGEGMSHIGKENGRFAMEFLDLEGIPCSSKSLGGNQARRLRYNPTTGLVKQRLVDRAPVETIKECSAGSSGDEIQFFED